MFGAESDSQTLQPPLSLCSQGIAIRPKVPSERHSGPFLSRVALQIQVDAKFFRILGKILQIVFPSWNSLETMLLGILMLQLFARLWVSYKLSRIGAGNAQNLVARDYAGLLRVSLYLCAVSELFRRESEPLNCCAHHLSLLCTPPMPPMHATSRSWHAALRF